MEIMYNRKNGVRYEVYGIDVDHGVAMCYNSSLAHKSNGNGWEKVQMKLLIPEDFYDGANKKYVSKTERNEVKSHLKLVDAVWETTDGQRYTHAGLDTAIDHQRKLLAADAAACAAAEVKPLAPIDIE